jgi:hypothetical protein
MSQYTVPSMKKREDKILRAVSDRNPDPTNPIWAAVRYNSADSSRSIVTPPPEAQAEFAGWQAEFANRQGNNVQAPLANWQGNNVQALLGRQHGRQHNS